MVDMWVLNTHALIIRSIATKETDPQHTSRPCDILIMRTLI